MKQLAHKIALIPTPEQEDYFCRAAGTARFAYNWGGAKNDELTLSERLFLCPSCGHTEDRDLHAAINIHAEGLRNARKRTDGQSGTGDPRKGNADAHGHLTSTPDGPRKRFGRRKSGGRGGKHVKAEKPVAGVHSGNI